jgi:hypothetical protein
MKFSEQTAAVKAAVCLVVKVNAKFISNATIAGYALKCKSLIRLLLIVL